MAASADNRSLKLMLTEAEIDELKRHCQAQFSDGLVIIVGSGLSCAEGLPGMGELADHLRSEIGRHIESADRADWDAISELIRTKSLEPALLERPPGPHLQGVIASVTASFIGARERTAIEEVFNGVRTLRLTRLMKHVLKSDAGIPIITTNYDRLVEIAAEEAGLGVDSMFVGDFAGTLNAHEARFSHCRGVTFPKARSAKLQFRSRVVVSKPHGSLDWYLRGGTPVRYGGDLPNATRLIIPPGQNKFRSGYEQPFDRQRERANTAIDQASRFLLIGYGFNDGHLETHLRPALQSGKPAIVITRELTPTAGDLARSLPNVTSFDRSADDGTRLIWGLDQSDLPRVDYWDLNGFIRQVFGT